MFDQMLAEKIIEGPVINREPPGDVYVEDSFVDRAGICIEPSIQHIRACA